MKTLLKPIKPYWLPVLISILAWWGPWVAVIAWMREWEEAGIVFICVPLAIFLVPLLVLFDAANLRLWGGDTLLEKTIEPCVDWLLEGNYLWVSLILGLLVLGAMAEIGKGSGRRMTAVALLMVVSQIVLIVLVDL